MFDMNKFSVLAFLMLLVCLSACQTKTAEPPVPQHEEITGDRIKTFRTTQDDFTIQLNLTTLMEKAGMDGKPTDDVIEDLIDELPDEVQSFFDGFEADSGWSQPLLPEVDYDMVLLCDDESGQPAYFTLCFRQGSLDFYMYNFKAFSTLYNLPDDLSYIRLPQEVGTFQYQQVGDSILTASIQLVNLKTISRRI